MNHLKLKNVYDKSSKFIPVLYSVRTDGILILNTEKFKFLID